MGQRDLPGASERRRPRLGEPDLTPGAQDNLVEASASNRRLVSNPPQDQSSLGNQIVHDVLTGTGLGALSPIIAAEMVLQQSGVHGDALGRESNEAMQGYLRAPADQMGDLMGQLDPQTRHLIERSLPYLGMPNEMLPRDPTHGASPQGTPRTPGSGVPGQPGGPPGLSTSAPPSFGIPGFGIPGMAVPSAEEDDLGSLFTQFARMPDAELDRALLDTGMAFVRALGESGLHQVLFGEPQTAEAPQVETQQVETQPVETQVPQVEPTPQPLSEPLSTAPAPEVPAPEVPAPEAPAPEVPAPQAAPAPAAPAPQEAAPAAPAEGAQQAPAPTAPTAAAPTAAAPTAAAAPNAPVAPAPVPTLNAPTTPVPETRSVAPVAPVAPQQAPVTPDMPTTAPAPAARVQPAAVPSMPAPAAPQPAPQSNPLPVVAPPVAKGIDAAEAPQPVNFDLQTDFPVPPQLQGGGGGGAAPAHDCNAGGEQAQSQVGEGVVPQNEAQPAPAAPGGLPGSSGDAVLQTGVNPGGIGGVTHAPDAAMTPGGAAPAGGESVAPVVQTGLNPAVNTPLPAGQTHTPEGISAPTNVPTMGAVDGGAGGGGGGTLPTATIPQANYSGGSDSLPAPQAPQVPDVAGQGSSQAEQQMRQDAQQMQGVQPAVDGQIASEAAPQQAAGDKSIWDQITAFFSGLFSKEGEANQVPTDAASQRAAAQQSTAQLVSSAQQQQQAQQAQQAGMPVPAELTNRQSYMEPVTAAEAQAVAAWSTGPQTQMPSGTTAAMTQAQSQVTAMQGQVQQPNLAGTVGAVSLPDPGLQVQQFSDVVDPSMTQFDPSMIPGPTPYSGGGGGGGGDAMGQIQADVDGQLTGEVMGFQQELISEHSARASQSMETSASETESCFQGTVDNATDALSQYQSADIAGTVAPFDAQANAAFQGAQTGAEAASTEMTAAFQTQTGQYDATVAGAGGTFQGTVDAARTTHSASLQTAGQGYDQTVGQAQQQMSTAQGAAMGTYQNAATAATQGAQQTFEQENQAAATAISGHQGQFQSQYAQHRASADAVGTQAQSQFQGQFSTQMSQLQSQTTSQVRATQGQIDQQISTGSSEVRGHLQQGQQQAQQQMNTGLQQAQQEQAAAQQQADAKRREAEGQQDDRNLLQKAGDAIVDFVKSALDWIKARFEEAKQAILGFLEAARDLALQALAAARDLALAVLDRVRGFIKGLISVLADVLRAFVSAFARFFEALVRFFIEWILRQLQAITALITGLIEVFQQMVNLVVQGLIAAVALIDQDLANRLQSAADVFLGAFNSACDQAQSAIETASQALQSQIQAAGDALVAGIQSAEQAFLTAIDTAEQALHAGVDAAYNAAVSKVNELYQAAVDTVNTLYEAARQAVVALIDGLYSLIETVALEYAKHISEVLNALGTAAAWIQDNIVGPLMEFLADPWTGLRKMWVSFWNSPWRDVLLGVALSALATVLVVATGGLGLVAIIAITAAVTGAAAAATYGLGEMAARTANVSLLQEGHQTWQGSSMIDPRSGQMVPDPRDPKNAWYLDTMGSISSNPDGSMSYRDKDGNLVTVTADQLQNDPSAIIAMMDQGLARGEDGQLTGESTSESLRGAAAIAADKGIEWTINGAVTAATMGMGNKLTALAQAGRMSQVAATTTRVAGSAALSSAGELVSAPLSDAVGEMVADGRSFNEAMDMAWQHDSVGDVARSFLTSMAVNATGDMLGGSSGYLYNPAAGKGSLVRGTLADGATGVMTSTSGMVIQNASEAFFGDQPRLDENGNPISRWDYFVDRTFSQDALDQIVQGTVENALSARGDQWATRTGERMRPQVTAVFGSRGNVAVDRALEGIPTTSAAGANTTQPNQTQAGNTQQPGGTQQPVNTQPQTTQTQPSTQTQPGTQTVAPQGDQTATLPAGGDPPSGTLRPPTQTPPQTVQDTPATQGPGPQGPTQRQPELAPTSGNASALPGSRFHGDNGDRPLQPADIQQGLDGVNQLPPEFGGGTLQQTPDGPQVQLAVPGPDGQSRPVNVRVETAPSSSERFAGSDGVAAAQFVRNDDGSYTVYVSDRLRPEDVTRALAHEMAEIRHQEQHGASEGGNQAGALRPDAPMDTPLTAHDVGRLAEISVVTNELQGLPADSPRRQQLQDELRILLAQTGLEGDAQSAQRQEALRRQVEAGNLPASLLPSLAPRGNEPATPRQTPPSPVERMRAFRDQSLDNVVGRSALRVVNGGLYQLLNPGDQQHPHGFPLQNGSGHQAHSVEQRYALIDAVQGLMLRGMNQNDIDALARQALVSIDRDLPPAEQAQAVTDAFLVLAAQQRDRADRTALPQDLAPEQRQQLLDRLGRLRYLEGLDAQIRQEAQPAAGEGPEAYQRELQELLRSGSVDDAMAALDERTNELLQRVIARQDRLGQDLSTLGQGPLGSPRPAPTPLDQQSLPRDHDNYQKLEELRSRLDQGEQSAIGGRDYPIMRFPEEVLQAAVRGDVHTVVYNGSHENALAYVQARYGNGSEGRVMGLQGLDGSGPRTVVTFEDGTQFLIVVGAGESRQLHNAGGLLLYTDQEGNRIPADRLELAGDGVDIAPTLRGDLESAVAQQSTPPAELGFQGDPSSIPTQLVVIQNPDHLAKALGDRAVWVDPPKGALLPFRMAYVRDSEGNLTRVILPKVGGNGLYGDTAGKFVQAFFQADLGPRNGDVIFNGTAGGFANTHDRQDFRDNDIQGLGDVRPGGVIMPQSTISQAGSEAMQMRTLLHELGFGTDADMTPEQLRQALQQAEANLTDHHVAVKAPAVETYHLIDELVAQGNASIDVEGASIMAAIARLRADGADATFTPVYTHSDDPRASQHDHFDSLAMMGPFLEGSTFNAPMFEVITQLMDISARRRGGEGGETAPPAPPAPPGPTSSSGGPPLPPSSESGLQLPIGPRPIQQGGQNWHFDGIDADGQVRMRPTGSTEIAVPMRDLSQLRPTDGGELVQGSTVEYLGRTYVLDRISRQQDGEGGGAVLRPVGRDERLTVPVDQVGPFQAYIAGQDGVFTIQERGGELEAVPSDGGPAIRVDPTQVEPTFRTATLDQGFGPMEVHGSALRVARQQTGLDLPGAGAPRPQGSVLDPARGIGSATDVREVTVANSSELLTQLAQQIREGTGPVDMHMRRFRTEDGKANKTKAEAQAVVQALIDRANAGDPVTIAYGNDGAHSLLKELSPELREQFLQNPNIRIQTDTDPALGSPYNHAKTTVIRGDDAQVMLSTGPVDTLQKVEGTVRLGGEAATLYAEYTNLLASGEISARRAQVLDELAARGIAVNDPVMGRYYASQAQVGLISDSDVAVRMWVKELDDPNVAQRLIERAQQGVAIDMTLRKIDPESERLIREALEKDPSLPLVVRQSTVKEGYWHGNAVFGMSQTGDLQAAVGTNYMWTQQNSNVASTTSFENAAVLGGRDAWNLHQQLVDVESRSGGEADPLLGTAGVRPQSFDLPPSVAPLALDVTGQAAALPDSTFRGDRSSAPLRQHTVGEGLREFREAAGLSRRELSFRQGDDGSHIATLEVPADNGQRRDVPIRIVTVDPTDAGLRSEHGVSAAHYRRDDDGSYTVFLSNGTSSDDVTRALAHEMAEIRFLERTGQVEGAADAGALQPGSAVDARLSAHDAGRMAELATLVAKLDRLQAPSDDHPGSQRYQDTLREVDILLQQTGLADINSSSRERMRILRAETEAGNLPSTVLAHVQRHLAPQLGVDLADTQRRVGDMARGLYTGSDHSDPEAILKAVRGLDEHQARAFKDVLSEQFGLDLTTLQSQLKGRIGPADYAEVMAHLAGDPYQGSLVALRNTMRDKTLTAEGKALDPDIQKQGPGWTRLLWDIGGAVGAGFRRASKDRTGAIDVLATMGAEDRARLLREQGPLIEKLGEGIPKEGPLRQQWEALTTAPTKPLEQWAVRSRAEYLLGHLQQQLQGDGGLTGRLRTNREGAVETLDLLRQDPELYGAMVGALKRRNPQGDPRHELEQMFEQSLRRQSGGDDLMGVVQAKLAQAALGRKHQDLIVKLRDAGLPVVDGMQLAELSALGEDPATRARLVKAIGGHQVDELMRYAGHRRELDHQETAHRVLTATRAHRFDDLLGVLTDNTGQVLTEQLARTDLSDKDRRLAEFRLSTWRQDREQLVQTIEEVAGKPFDELVTSELHSGASRAGNVLSRMFGAGDAVRFRETVLPALVRDGTLPPHDQLQLGLVGLGSDQKLAAGALQGKSPEQIQALAADFRRTFGDQYGSDLRRYGAPGQEVDFLRAVLTRELSGRGRFDALRLLHGDPSKVFDPGNRDLTAEQRQEQASQRWEMERELLGESYSFEKKRTGAYDWALDHQQRWGQLHTVDRLDHRHLQLAVYMEQNAALLQKGDAATWESLELLRESYDAAAAHNDAYRSQWAKKAPRMAGTVATIGAGVALPIFGMALPMAARALISTGQYAATEMLDPTRSRNKTVADGTATAFGLGLSTLLPGELRDEFHERVLGMGGQAASRRAVEYGYDWRNSRRDQELRRNAFSDTLKAMLSGGTTEGSRNLSRAFDQDPSQVDPLEGVFRQTTDRPFKQADAASKSAVDQAVNRSTSGRGMAQGPRPEDGGKPIGTGELLEGAVPRLRGQGRKKKRRG
jgi:hypothetical protein